MSLNSIAGLMPGAVDVFKQLDKNGDGKITPGEFGVSSSSVLSSSATAASPRETTFDTMDADGDGATSQSEFAAFHDKLFAKMSEITQGGGLLQYLGGGENQWLESRTPSVASLLEGMKAREEGNTQALTGEISALIEKLKAMVAPGDLLNIDA